MQQPEDTTTAGPLALSLHAGLGPNATERDKFLAWLRAYAGGGENWRGNVLMGEHDIALALWKDRQRQIDRLTAALKTANEQTERFERGCYLRGDALEVAVRQNEHDMLMTGDELRACRAALDALGPNVADKLAPARAEAGK